MKRVFLILLVASTAFFACNNAEKKTETGAEIAKIEFAEESWDFGKIIMGDTVSHDFAFTNTGEIPLIISNASATCGCTVPEYPKEPVAPGESGIIKVKFDSSNKTGKQHKVITLTTNATPAQSEIFLTGEISDPNAQTSKQP